MLQIFKEDAFGSHLHALSAKLLFGFPVQIAVNSIWKLAREIRIQFTVYSNSIVGYKKQ